MTIDLSQVAPPPLVTGEELKALGLSEGPRLGKILHQLYDMQLAEQFHTRQQAMAAAGEMVAQSQ